jgi:hypothetical protein
MLAEKSSNSLMEAIAESSDLTKTMLNMRIFSELHRRDRMCAHYQWHQSCGSSSRNRISVISLIEEQNSEMIRIPGRGHIMKSVRNLRS